MQPVHTQKPATGAGTRSDRESSRRDWMSLLAKARPETLQTLWRAAGFAPDHVWLRAPECGAVMVRGRAGGTGAPFNLGEMTVTRCALRLASGEIGHAWSPGRDKRHAATAALCDALMQSEPQRVAIAAKILDPLRAAAADIARTRAEKAAATKVEFFTLVRGED